MMKKKDVKEIEELIRKGESESVEFKPSLSQINGIVETISGFSNLKGGIIFVGISDSGKILGCEIGKGTIENLSNTINQSIEPRIHPEISVHEIECKKIIVICVCESVDKPVLAFGKLYKRVGKSTLLSSRHEFEKLILEKHKEKIQFDKQICEEATLKDINKKTVNDFIKLAENSKRLNGNIGSVKIILEKLGLSKNNQLKNSAILLFGKEPKKFFRNNIIKCGRFKGEEKEEFIDLKDFEGNLFENLESSINFLKEHLRISAKIKGISRIEKWEIPLEAFREALINAMIHRDYTNSGFIYIKIYDSKIIISNPGELPDELDIKDLYKEHESFPRNPLLAETFYYTGFIDVWGRGSLNIIRLLRENGLEKPLFEQSGGYFRIIFNRAKEESGGVNGGLSGGLSGGLKLVFDLISSREGIKAKEIAEKLSISERTLDRNISKLIKSGKIERRGSRKIGGYFVMDNKKDVKGGEKS